jgi:hypothetical protein
MRQHFVDGVQRAAIGLVEAAADGRFESGVLILSHVGSGIEQQKLKALRRLRHPSRSKRLKSFSDL